MSELDDLTSAAARAQSDIADAARTAIDSLPWLASSISDDRAHGRFDIWGRSTAIDENVGAPVITRALFDELHDRAGIHATWPIGNAGLLHCYGYLLSLAATPYGLKRDRWLEGELPAACHLEAGAFLPWTPGATLLDRATSVARALLETAGKIVAADVDGRATRIALSARRGPGALAYAVAPSPHDKLLLVTMFPVADLDAVHLDVTTETRLRWNAV